MLLPYAIGILIERIERSKIDRPAVRKMKRAKDQKCQKEGKGRYRSVAGAVGGGGSGRLKGVGEGVPCDVDQAVSR